MSTNFLSGRVLPTPISFGPGVLSGWLIGDAISGVWNYNNGAFTKLSGGGFSGFQESRCPYIFLSGSNILVADSAYGLLTLTTGSSGVTGIALSGGPWMSCIEAQGGNNYGVDSSGHVSNTTGTVGAPFWGASPQGQGNQFDGFRGPQGIADFVFTSSATINIGLAGLTSGMQESSCAAVLSSSEGIIGGWGVAAFGSGVQTFGISLAASGTALGFAPGISGGTATAWAPPIGNPPLWTLINSVSGLGVGAISDIDFYSPVSAVAIDVTNNLFRAFSYIGGSLTQIQTLAVTGTARDIGVSNSGFALISQTSTSSVIQLGLSGTTWVFSGVALSGISTPSAISIQGASAAIGWLNSISIISGGPTWALVGSASLGFTPQSMTQDVSGNYWAVGQGAGALVSPLGVVLASGDFDATGPTIFGASYYQNQYYAVSSSYVAVVQYQPWVPAMTLISSASNSGMANQLYSDALGVVWTPFSGTPTFGRSTWFGDALLVPTQNGMIELTEEAPFKLGYHRAGSSVLNNGSYLSFSGFGLGNNPCQIAVDSSGNTRIVTVEGNSFIMTSGNVVSSVTSIFASGGSLVSLVSGAGGMWGATATVPCVVNFQ